MVKKAAPEAESESNVIPLRRAQLSAISESAKTTKAAKQKAMDDMLAHEADIARKRSRLHKKVCADCKHPWRTHFRFACSGDPSGFTCYCERFVKAPGDVI